MRLPQSALAGLTAAAGATAIVLGAHQISSIVAIGVLVALPVAVLVMRRPQLGLLVLMATVPYDGLLVLVGDAGPIVAWKDVLLGFTAVASLTNPTSHRRRRPAWLDSFIPFIVLVIVSGVVVGGYQGAIGIKILLFASVALVVLHRHPFTTRDRDLLVTGLMVNAAICAAFAIVQQRLGHVRLNDLGYQYNKVIRFNGAYMRSWSTFVEPFNFAYFMMVAVLLGLAVALSDVARLRNRLFLMALPIMLFGMATSIVRGSWLGLAVGLALLGFTHHRVLLLGIPIGLAGLLLLPSSASDSAFSSNSAEARAESWRENIGSIAAHPLGQGVGTTGAANAKARIQSDYASPAGIQPDNWYLKVAFEVGPIGLWLWLHTAAGWWRTSTRFMRVSPRGPDADFVHGVRAFLVAAVVVSINSTFFEIFPLDLITWVLVGTVSAMSTDVTTRSRRRQPTEDTGNVLSHASGDRP